MKKGTKIVYTCPICDISRVVGWKYGRPQGGYSICRGCSISVSRTTNKSGTSHGMSRTPLYAVWQAMIQRCTNPNNRFYKDYGGRGIGICQAWDTFFPFYKWAVSSGYDKGLLLDRINNDKGYGPHNCRWVTSKVSASNRRLPNDGTRTAVSQTGS